MAFPAKLKTIAVKTLQSLAREKDPKLPLSALAEASLLIIVMAALMFFDPFKVYYKIIDFLRLRFYIFTKEPKLLFYTYMYIGSFIAKAAMLFLIIILVIARRERLEKDLALRPPTSREWLSYIPIFAAMSAGIRIYYSINPLLPNLPIRLVFPETMIIGNAIVILSVLFIAPITEEIIFRGYLFDVFKRSLGAYSSIILTSIIFTLAHFPHLDIELPHTAIILLLGFTFGILRYKTGSIFAPMAFHGLYNLVYVIVGVFNYFFLGY